MGPHTWDERRGWINCPLPDYRDRCQCYGPCSGLCGGACSAPEPELDEFSAEVLTVFLSCQTQWDRAGMSGVRTGIPRERVVIEATTRGVDVSEAFLDKFRSCEGLILQQQNEQAERDEQARKATEQQSNNSVRLM